MNSVTTKLSNFPRDYIYVYIHTHTHTHTHTHIYTYIYIHAETNCVMVPNILKEKH